MRPEPSQELFETDRTHGALRRSGGGRLGTLSLEFVRTLHQTVASQFGDQAGNILYRTGFEWGLQDLARLNREMRAQYGAGSFDLWQMETRFILDSWWEGLAEAGWGRCTFAPSGRAGGVVVAILRDSAVASGREPAENPVCHVYAGLLAGALSFFERTERHAAEIQCQALGHEECRFVVGAGPAIDQAEAWRKQGVAPDEIIQRLSH